MQFFIIPQNIVAMLSNNTANWTQKYVSMNNGEYVLRGKYVQETLNRHHITMIASSRANDEHVYRILPNGVEPNADVSPEAISQQIIQSIVQESGEYMLPSFAQSLSFAQREWIPRLRWGQNKKTDTLWELQCTPTPIEQHPEELPTRLQSAIDNNKYLPSTEEIVIINEAGNMHLPLPEFGDRNKDDGPLAYIHLNGAPIPADTPIPPLSEEEITARNKIPTYNQQFTNPFRNSLPRLPTNHIAKHLSPTYNFRDKNGVIYQTSSEYSNNMQPMIILRIGNHYYIPHSIMNTPCMMQLLQTQIANIGLPIAQFPPRLNDIVTIEKLCKSITSPTEKYWQHMLRQTIDSNAQDAFAPQRTWVNSTNKEITDITKMRKHLHGTINPETINKQAKNTLEQFIHMRGVERVEVNESDNTLNVYTTALKITPGYTRDIPQNTTRDELPSIYAVRKGGKYRISFSLNEQTDPRVTNLTRNINNTQHPHIQNHTCWGNMGEILFNLIADRDYATMTSMVISYLETCNLEDIWGRSVEHWPIDDGADTP